MLYDPRSRGAEVYKELAKEVIEGEGETKRDEKRGLGKGLRALIPATKYGKSSTDTGGWEIKRDTTKQLSATPCVR
jgi:hypothetical protein